MVRPYIWAGRWRRIRRRRAFAGCLSFLLLVCVLGACALVFIAPLRLEGLALLGR